MNNTFYKFCFLLCFAGMQFNASGQLIITGIFDFDLTGGLPKGVELYVLQDISDLTIYGLGSANNGGGSDNEEYTFPAGSAVAGEYIYISREVTGFTAYFGFAPDYTASAMDINGDDAVELFQNGVVIDTYGDPDTNGDYEVWDYTDSWAYRNDNTSANPTFDSNDWSFAGREAAENCSTNASCGSIMPIGSYSPAPLPIELINFSLRSNESSVDLDWSTASEQDNAYFQLERAGADRNFEVLAKIDGALNSSNINTYAYTDASPLSGLNYYRLVQVDLDGTMHYHNTLSYQQSGKGELTVYPNPAKDQLMVGTADMIGGTLELCDLSGRIIQTKIITGKLSELSIDALQSGMYILSVEYNGIRFNDRFVKQ